MASYIVYFTRGHCALDNASAKGILEFCLDDNGSGVLGRDIDMCVLSLGQEIF